MNTTYVQQETDKVLKEMKDEFIEDFTLSIDVLAEKTLRVPLIKHKWVARLQQCKMQERLLKEEYSKRTEIEKNEIRKNVKVDLSDSDMNQVRVKNSERMEEIDNLLQIVNFKKEYLEMMTSSMQYNFSKDISNMIEMHKLETQ